MKYAVSLFLIIFLWPSFAFSQEVAENSKLSETHLKKNSVFGNVGFIYPWISASASISYDRSIFIAEDDTDIRAKASVGFIGVFMAGTFNYQSLTIGLLKGSKNSHFELFGGGAFYQNDPPSTPGHREEGSVGFFPVGNIGYRFQKPDGWFVFRAGVGFPDLGYVGVGVAF